MYSGPQRKNLRLKDYDYSQDGIYFVTFCSYKKQCFFGDIIDGEMKLNDYGKLVEKYCLQIPEHFANVELGEFVIMPNHAHLIITLVGTADLLSLQENSSQERTKMLLSKVIHGVKSSCTRQIRKQFNDYEFKWQRSFYDVIINNDEQLHKTRLYIEQNPLKWDLDVNNPENEERVKELRKQGRR